MYKSDYNHVSTHFPKFYDQIWNIRMITAFMHNYNGQNVYYNFFGAILYNIESVIKCPPQFQGFCLKLLEVISGS